MTLRRLRPEEVRLWALVASTIPGGGPKDGAELPDEAAPEPEPCLPPRPPPEPPGPPPRARASAEALAMLLRAGVAAQPSRPLPSVAPPPAIAPIEPNRKRRIVRAREPIGGRLDLHGYGQDGARSALHAFIGQAQADGARAVLVITGKGRVGEGLLRRRAPEWLAEPPSRARVAGVSVAEARHGGEGALYVALKRRA